jgi:hypothetical protein
MSESATNLIIANADKETPNSCNDASLSSSNVKASSVIWQVQKESYPIVYADKNSTMVNFLFGNNQYKLKWCRDTGELHLSLQDGKCIYTKGSSVIVDASIMSTTAVSENPVDKVKDLDIWEHSHSLERKDQQQLRDGLYIFDLVNDDSNLFSRKKSSASC